jgi:hypothetical protein
VQAAGSELWLKLIEPSSVIAKMSAYMRRTVSTAEHALPAPAAGNAVVGVKLEKVQ